MPAKRKRCNTGENLADYERCCQAGSGAEGGSYARHPNKRSASNTHMSVVPEHVNSNGGMPASKLQKTSSKYFRAIYGAPLFICFMLGELFSQKFNFYVTFKIIQIKLCHRQPFHRHS